jgi:hypothetical protein
VLWLRAE